MLQLWRTAAAAVAAELLRLVALLLPVLLLRLLRCLCVWRALLLWWCEWLVWLGAW